MFAGLAMSHLRLTGKIGEDGFQQGRPLFFKWTPNQHPTAVELLLLSNHWLGRLLQGESGLCRCSVVWSIRLRPEGTAVLHGIWHGRLIRFGFFIAIHPYCGNLLHPSSLYLNACKLWAVANEGDPLIIQIVHGASWWHHVAWIVKLFSDPWHVKVSGMTFRSTKCACWKNPMHVALLLRWEACNILGLGIFCQMIVVK